jgi:hypothetical protein
MPQSNLAVRTSPTVPAAHATSNEAERVSPRPARVSAPSARPKARAWPVVIMLTGLAAANAAGAPYYSAPRAVQVRHEWHEALRPSGIVGQSAGLLALAVFLFLWLYPLRKRFKSLAWTGSVGRWLDVHVVAAIGLPLLLTAHAAWRSEGLIGLGFNAILVVCASGVVGRYLYTRIPRTKAGMELTRDEVSRERATLISEIAQVTGLSSTAIEASLHVQAPEGATSSAWSAVRQLVIGDWERWKQVRALPRRWAELGGAGHRVDAGSVRAALRMARREIALTQQARLLDATHRIFRFWHVAHRPFAITALLAVVIHVVVVVAMGATWFY